MGRIRKRHVALIVIGIPVAVVVVLVVAVIGVLMFVGLPLVDGTELSDGQVIVASYRWGPIRMGAYLFRLEGGGFGLIDATQDPAAEAILSALARLGASRDDVHAVFITHGHRDHAQGALSFPGAAVYVLDPDAGEVRRQGVNVTRGLSDGEVVNVSGTPVEVFAIPGHTAGSAAYLVHGVLFLGDTASGIEETVLAHNAYINDDAVRSEASLRNLAERLRNRVAEVRHIAFGHHGPVRGLEPLLVWAASKGQP